MGEVLLGDEAWLGMKSMQEAVLEGGFRHRMVKVGGLQLHVVEAGPEDGWPVILLHGFPEYSGAWEVQMRALAARGWRVIAPDQRGYNLSDAPMDAAAYHLDTLAKDVVGIMDALDVKTAAVVGHDWGGAVAWWLGVHHGARLERLIVLDCPHVAVMARRIWWPKQLLRSSYMLLFQLPGIAEHVCRRDNFQFLRRALMTANEGTFTQADVERYIAAWSKPGALTGMLNWYRAALRSVGAMWRAGRVAVPTLLIWGKKDLFLGLDLARPSVAMCDDGRLAVIDDATHWIQHEHPERVCGWMDAFLRGEAVGEERA